MAITAEALGTTIRELREHLGSHAKFMKWGKKQSSLGDEALERIFAHLNSMTEQLVEKEKKRAELNRKVSTGKGTPAEAKELKALEIEIPAFVVGNKIPGSMHMGIRNKLAVHREEALSGLMDYSNDKIDKMNEPEVLGVLKSMKQ